MFQQKKRIGQSGFMKILPSLFLYLGIIGLMVGCTSSGVTKDSLDKTQAALSIQMTSLAQQLVVNQKVTQDSLSKTQVAQSALETQSAALATELALQATAPVAIPSVTPENNASETPVSLDTQVRGAKILLFENMSGQRIYGIYTKRYIKDAFDYQGLSYIDVGSAQGWLRDELLSTNTYDLIIIASEANSNIQGEYFNYLRKHIDNGSSVILELWDLDQIHTGTIAPILEKCGVGLYADWTNVSNFALFPTYPDHPIFNVPNDDISLTNSSPFWEEDNGDLLKLTGSGDAKLLAGPNPKLTTDHGMLAECMGGKMLLQTFRTHDYAMIDMEKLWLNYVYYVLGHKFASTP